MKPTQSIEDLKGVGPAQAKKFERLHIRTIEDLLRHYPRRYFDYSMVVTINELQPGQVTIKGKVSAVKGRYVRRGLHITEGIISDHTGSIKVVWFNQPYRANAIKSGQEYFVSGKFELARLHMQIMNPSMELASDFPIHTARIIPQYPETKNLKSTEIRKAIKQALDNVNKLNDIVPEHIRLKFNLLPLKEAFHLIHFPKTTDDVALAKRRLGFGEIFELILAHLMTKQELAQEAALSIPFEQTIAKRFVKNLPFELTASQKLAVWEVYKDIHTTRPMNRLIEGDVGSGKTVVAAMASAMAIHHDLQAILMAPTELLARQHADTMSNLLEPLGQEKTIVLLVGSMTEAQKTKARRAIKSGKAKCIIGTHALIQEKVDVHKLSLIIIDEQHRFGVEQRKELLKKAGHMPHLMSMTATPIPRSLALTVYGDLDISILNDKPPGRKPIKTKVINKNGRLDLYKELEPKLMKGEQLFVVCPLIDESESMSARSVSEVHKELSEKVYPKLKVGLLHGRLKTDKKQQVMEDFVKGKYQVLVSTTVIEVGVDVPAATMMVVEGVERFGLAQIHQLRGRIGRNDQQGHCYLVLSDDQEPSKRIRAAATSSDGFRLAELDLELRGPGAIYGTDQHGELDLRIASLSDTVLIKEAREAAHDCINSDPTLLQYPQTLARINVLQKIVHLN